MCPALFRSITRIMASRKRFNSYANNVAWACSWKNYYGRTRDLTSEIFLKAVSRIDRERSLRSMQYWLYLIARTTIADYWRVHYRRPTRSLDALLEAGWEGPVDEELTAINIESAERAQQLLQALPEQYRKVLTCRFLLNLSIKATAVRMGVSVANVKVLQFRALKRAADLERAVTEQHRGAM